MTKPNNRQIAGARRRLQHQGFRPCTAADETASDYKSRGRADILMPDGSREVWLKPPEDRP